MAGFDPKDVSNIDANDFNYEWMRQANLVQNVMTVVAEVERDCARAKEDYRAFVRAELYEKIKKFPASFGIDKPTETAVEMALVQQPEYKQAFQVYLDKQYQLDVLKGVEKSLDHKKAALENLCRREEKGLKAEPFIPRTVRERATEDFVKEETALLNETAAQPVTGAEAGVSAGRRRFGGA